MKPGTVALVQQQSAKSEHRIIPPPALVKSTLTLEHLALNLVADTILENRSLCGIHLTRDAQRTGWVVICTALVASLCGTCGLATWANHVDST